MPGTLSDSIRSLVANSNPMRTGFHLQSLPGVSTFWAAAADRLDVVGRERELQRATV
jgi:hypothetical protein